MVLIPLVNCSSGGNQAGLDTFIFSQAASMGRNDVISMSILAVVVILIVTVGFKSGSYFCLTLILVKVLNFPLKE